MIQRQGGCSILLVSTNKVGTTMVTKDRPTGYCRITRRCIAEYYSMGRTRGIVLKVLIDCSWNQSRNTWKYENAVPVVFGNLGALRILPGVERDGFAHSPHSISFPLISIRDQLIKTSIYHLHTVCCSEARALRLGCWEHIILRITDLIQHHVEGHIKQVAQQAGEKHN